MITLTQKERMLLEDLKKHEQLCITKYSEGANKTQCPELKQIFTKNMNQETQHLNTINQMLAGQIPSMGSQQQSQMNQQQATPQNQTMTNNMQSSTPGQYNQNDYNLCIDALTAEKYISGTYDTSIFEFTVPEYRQALNHIQKEEQEHGEAIFKYMQSKGMYNPQ